MCACLYGTLKLPPRLNIDVGLLNSVVPWNVSKTGYSWGKPFFSTEHLLSKLYCLTTSRSELWSFGAPSSTQMICSKGRAVKLRVQSWLTLIIVCQLVFVLKYILMGIIFQVFETTNLCKSFVTMYVLN